MTDLALFDFDGTLTDSESFGPFLRQLVPAERMRSGRWRVAPWVLGYRLGLLSGEGGRARVVDIGLCGLPVADYRKAGECFAREWIPAHLRRDAMARLQWHRGRGDTVAVVSGAFDAYLAPWCEAEGIAVLCSTLAVADGKLTGRYAGAQCVGVEKPRRVHQRFNPALFTRVHAYGDTREDRELLAIADERWYRSVRVDQ